MTYPKNLFFTSIFLCIAIFTAGAKETSASEKKTALTSLPYYFTIGSQCPHQPKARIQPNAKITNGSVSVLHNVDPNTNSGTDVVRVGESWTFTNDPYDPVFNANDGAWDTPIGSFCSEIDEPCFGEDNITKEAADEDSIGSQKISGKDSREGFVYWTAVKPDFTVESDNPAVISCTGKTCKAMPGSEGQQAEISVKIAPTPARIWAFIFANYKKLFDPSAAGKEKWVWASGNEKSMLFPFSPAPASGVCKSTNLPFLGHSSMELPAKDIPFTFTVEVIVPPVLPPGSPSIDLKVDGGDHKSIADALVKQSEEDVTFNWTSGNVSNCWANEAVGDPSWQDADVPPDGNIPNYTLPPVSLTTNIEYKISCNDEITQNGFWNKILAFFSFIKNAFAQGVGDVEDSVFITVNPPGPSPLSVDISVSPNPANVGETVTWLASVSGGTSPYTYSWSGSDGLSGSGLSVSKSYGTVGSKTGTVNVTDSLGATDTDSTTLDVISGIPGPTASLTASPRFISGGQSSTLTWSCKNSALGVIDQGIGTVCSDEVLCAAGSTKSVAPTKKTKYILTCTSPNGIDIDQDDVTVQVGIIIEN